MARLRDDVDDALPLRIIEGRKADADLLHRNEAITIQPPSFMTKTNESTAIIDLC